MMRLPGSPDLLNVKSSPWVPLARISVSPGLAAPGLGVVHLRRPGPIQLADQPAGVSDQVDVRAVSEAERARVHLAAEARSRQHHAQRRGIDELEQLRLR